MIHSQHKVFKEFYDLHFPMIFSPELPKLLNNINHVSYSVIFNFPGQYLQISNI